MTLAEAIAATNELTGQVYAQSTMIRWLSELDGQIAFEVYHADAWTPYTADDLNDELLVPYPYDKMYVHHLEAMVYYSDGEYDRYTNASTMFNEKLGEFKRFIQRTLDCRGQITFAQTNGVSIFSERGF